MENEKKTPDNKPMTLKKLSIVIAEKSGLTSSQAKLVLKELVNVAVEQVNENHVFNVPGICRLTKVRKPPRPERQMINPFTKQEITVKAKPATNVVKVKLIRSLKNSVQ